ncbi:MAG TPA: PAS domain S-box protein, partial [Sphingomonas sp.]|nr:PAS domain S-box protein [Sphingomonas sp.]
MRFLDHEGEMAARIRAFDWSGHPLGPPRDWPDALKFALDVALGSTFPTAVYWGPELFLLYNDAWAPIPAERHPWALGRPGGEVWADIWDVVGPQMRGVIESGRGFAIYDQQLMMERDGRPQETWWNYSFTPVRDADGRVA